jgi:hypothetical protein
VWPHHNDQIKENTQGAQNLHVDSTSFCQPLLCPPQDLLWEMTGRVMCTAAQGMMDWSASVSRLETSIYLNFSALEELLHTYDDLFGSKQTLVVDKTLGCLCNAITDIMKKSSGTGREKIQRISTLKKIRSRLSDVKRWELDVASSCCQLSLITCRKFTAKLSRAFWIWKSQTLEERKNGIVDALGVDSDDCRDGYSNIPHSSSPHLPPLPNLTSESVQGQSSSDSSFHSESGLGDVDIGLTCSLTELSDVDDHSPDLSVDVSDDSIGLDQDVQIEPSESQSQSSSPNNSSYLASYLASPLRQKTKDISEEEDDSREDSAVLEEDEESQEQDSHRLQDTDQNNHEVEEDQIESQVTLDTLSQTTVPRGDGNGVRDHSISEFFNHESIPRSSPHQPLDFQRRDRETSPSAACEQSDSLIASNPSTSAIEIHWNEFSSSDEKSLSSPSPSEERNETSVDDGEEGFNAMREFGESEEEEEEELSKDELSDVVGGSQNPKDLSEYSLSDVMDYLSLPLERTPLKSLPSSSASSSTPSPSELDPEEPSPCAQKIPNSAHANQHELQKATPSRRVVSSTSVLTPRQSIPPPPPLHHPLAMADSPPLSSLPHPSHDHL